MRWNPGRINDITDAVENFKNGKVAGLIWNASAAAIRHLERQIACYHNKVPFWKKSVKIRGALNKSKCRDWRADFSPEEGKKSQEYCMYFKIF